MEPLRNSRSTGGIRVQSLKAIRIAPIDPPIAAIVFSATRGIEYARELAEWAGGKFSYDSMSEEQAAKTYYWLITIPGVTQHYRARPGDAILKHESGKFSTLRRDEFERRYGFYDHSGVYPCYFSIDDGKFHRKWSNYSEFAGRARCDLNTEVDLDSEDHTNEVSPLILCPDCFGSWYAKTNDDQGEVSGR